MNQPLTKLTLSNGLQVILKEIHTSPILSQWIWYRIGSRDELPGLTGASHWVEHMMFKGTHEFPLGALDRSVSREGGYLNAFTFLDWTSFFETLPADKSDLTLRLEADRMFNCLFEPNEVDSERTVVISERQGSENEPLFRLSEEVQSAAFRVHPYHHEIIGDLTDLYSMQRDDLYHHYRNYYVPNNAVLSIAGDFETQTLLKRVRELYEPLPVGPQPPRMARSEPAQVGERRVSVEGPGETVYLQVSYRAPRADDPDFFALNLLDSLLTGPTNLNMFGGGVTNKTSRLYEALVEKELAISINGGLQATIDPYLYTTVITVHPKHTASDCISAMEDEIKRLQDAPPPAEELERALKQARAIFAYGSESISNLAFWLGFAEMFATTEWFTSYLDRLAAITPADVQRMAQTCLRPQNRTLGVYLPNGPEQ
ncbi:MAG TPA: pitrilysin family protein [Anaerolineales bacterium]|nr:pitrilysin family protein [Anaerolineales bacterium]